MTNNKVFPRFDEAEDFTIIKIAQDSEDRERGLTYIAEVGVLAFREAHPEFPFSDANAALITSWLASHGDLPATRWNLELCYNDLKDDGLLFKAVQPQAPEADGGNPSITLSVQNALAEYRPPDSEVDALGKCKDDASLSDSARKNRDKKLEVLAAQQRRQYAGPRAPNFHETKIVI